jgi:energy-coupling factor transporter ATP-binding protein EcfA2
MKRPYEVLIEGLGSSVEYSEEKKKGIDIQLEHFPEPIRVCLVEQEPGSNSLSSFSENKAGVLLGSDFPDPQQFQNDCPVLVFGYYLPDYELFAFLSYPNSRKYENVNQRRLNWNLTEDCIERAYNSSFSTIAKQNGLGSEGTLILSESKNAWMNIQTRIALIGMRKILSHSLPKNWDNSPARAQQLGLVLWHFFAIGGGSPISERRRTAQRTVADRQGINYETVRSKSGGELWNKEPETNYHADFFEPVLDTLDTKWSYDLLNGIIWHDEEIPPLKELFGDLPPIADQQTEKDDVWYDPGAIVNAKEADGDDILSLSGDDLKKHLHFPNEIQGETPLTQRIDAALRSGDHLILTGPPGSGKSQLAEKICQHYRNDDYQLTTATGDWTTFDTVGGYRPQRDGGELRFTPGLFLERFETDENGEAKNEWLVIDELNRANIDEAFGSLFTVLTGGTVTLPFFVTEDDPDSEDSEENRVEVVGNPDETEPDLDHRYYVPDDWRLIATMNSVDKASLYRMSYAFMRRFSFVSVPVPTADVVEPELLEEYMKCWEIDPSDYEDDDDAPVDLGAYDNFGEKLRHDMALIWKVALQRGGNFGPGVIQDVLEHTLTELQTTDTLGYDQAIAAHLLPQFEGRTDKEVRKLIDGIENNSLRGLDDALPELEGPEDTTVSRQFAADHLGVDGVRDDSN